MSEFAAEPMGEPDVPVSPAAPQETVGEVLIAARERLGLSAGDVARQLRLGLRQVEALEQNRFGDLPGNTFVRGFLRNYAKAVQCDAASLLECYERSRPRPPVPEISAPAEQIDYTQKPTPRWVWYVAVLALLVFGLPLLIYMLLGDADIPHRGAQIAQPAPAVAPVAPSASSSAQEISLPLPPADSVSIASVPIAAPAPELVPGSAVAPPSQSDVPAAVPPRLMLSFQADAWVEIRDKSGRKVFSQIGRRGADEPVAGEPPFELIVGNAPQVRVVYNGKPVDLAPHTKVNVARLSLE